MAEPSITAPAVPAKKETKLKPPKKKRKWLKRLIILVVILALVGWFIVRPMMTAGQQITSAFYQTSEVSYQDLTVSVSSTGTVQPIDSYKLTALVKGEILNAPFEEGDTVNKDDLLYQIDSSDVENSIQQAQLSLETAQLNYNQTLKNQNDGKKDRLVKATDSGVITELYVDQGDNVTAGTVIADILDRDNMKLTVPFHSADAASFYIGQSATVKVDGTLDVLNGVIDSISATDDVGDGGTLIRKVTLKVTNPGAITDTTNGTATIAGADCAAGAPFVYGAKKQVVAKTSGELTSLTVKEGDRVHKDQVLGSFDETDMTTAIENARINVETAQLTLQNAKDRLDDYTITAPISGTIIEKNLKAGDNVDLSTSAAATGTSYMAVIYDMSTLTFDMKIDELDINKIKVGQTVSITADALQGETFTGRVDKVNINGVTANGVTSYPVTVVIDDPQELLPGMNVSAEIMVEQVSHALCVPVDAVTRGNIVQVAAPGALDATGKVVDPTKLEDREVTLGRNDARNIEITAGLQEGDVVVIKNDLTNPMAAMYGM